MASYRYQHPFHGTWAFGAKFGVKGSSWAAGYHTGQDYWSRSRGGDGKIHPICTGVISRIGTTGAYGNHIYVKHPDGYLSLYAHLSRIDVKKGQRVTYNSVLGIEGSTGKSTGPHLHLEIHWQTYKYPATINPRTFINARLKVAEEDIVTQREFDKMMANWQARHNRVYNNISDVPKYWRRDVRELVNIGAIRGDGVHQVGLTRETIKAVVTVKRAMEVRHPIYSTFKEIPAYLQPETQKLIDAGALRGNTPSQLDISYDTLRASIIGKRYTDAAVTTASKTPSGDKK